jgi:hypothetical protein
MNMKAASIFDAKKHEHAEVQLAELRGLPVRSQLKRRLRRGDRRRLKVALQMSLHMNVMEGIDAYRRAVALEQRARALPLVQQIAHADEAPVNMAFTFLGASVSFASYGGDDAGGAEIIPFPARPVTVIRKRRAKRPTTEVMALAA